jgi:hypothetical protein
MAFLCVSQQGEFKNTMKKLLGKVHVKNFSPKQIERKKTVFLSFVPFGFFIAFLAVYLNEELKTPQNIF